MSEGTIGQTQTPPTGTVLAGWDGSVIRLVKVDGSGNFVLSGDIEIGAVELKDSTTDVRVNVQAANVAATAASTVVLTQPVDNAGNKGVALSDGTAIYTGVKTGQLPAALVSSRLDVNVGANGSIAFNSGVTSATTQRVVLATDVALPAGTALLGKTGIDQTTPGTTNGVQVNAALPTGTNTIGAANVAPRTSGGLTVHHLSSAGTTNATNVKASAGQLYGWYIENSNASPRKVAFHNTAGTPTAGASIFFTVVVPGSGAANVEFTNGIAFATGIAYTTVTGLTDADATAVAAQDLSINLLFA